MKKRVGIRYFKKIELSGKAEERRSVLDLNQPEDSFEAATEMDEIVAKWG